MSELIPTPLSELRKPAPGQKAIDADAVRTLLRTASRVETAPAPSGLQQFALRVETWLLTRGKA